jgi:hypothetical protein
MNEQAVQQSVAAKLRAAMPLAEWVEKFPQHEAARRNWATSDRITRFLDYATTRGVELCTRHTHVEACYRATGQTVVLAGLVCGVPGATLICGLREDIYCPLRDQTQELSARYFGIDLAAYDREEVQLKAASVVPRPKCKDR